MAHIHLEDGSFTLLWVTVWWITAVLVLACTLFWLRRSGQVESRRITLAALCTAAAFAVFQVSIPVYGGVHLTLTPLIGILTGPAVGSLVVLSVNILSAAIGHGGWGMIGANALVNITEVVSAYAVYMGLARIAMTGFIRAGIAALAALVLGNLAMIAIILVSGVQGVTQSPGNLLYGLSVLAGLNMGVAVIEALMTGYIISYIQRVRPGMLPEGDHRDAGK
jgi:cobalt/nickel transport system permease protein